MADAPPHVLSPDEAEEQIRFAMELNVGRIRMGRQTWRDAMLERGLSMFARKVAEQLRLSGIRLLRNPPPPLHGSSEPKSPAQRTSS